MRKKNCGKMQKTVPTVFSKALLSNWKCSDARSSWTAEAGFRMADRTFPLASPVAEIVDMIGDTKLSFKIEPAAPVTAKAVWKKLLT